jgi:Na+-translocating ferredoxin:NAD+ oxidoreductase subunit B
VARIDPERCVGCARCLPACPVDAILGAQRYLHTVIERDCNGCELCLAACPVDCIDMVARTTGEHAPSFVANRQRYQQHRARTAARAQERASLLEARQQAALATVSQ